MGCSESKESPPKLKITVKKSAVDKSLLNRLDYIISHENKGNDNLHQVIIKEPGSINGQQFIIEDSNYCSIFLFDIMECVTVDNCKHIRLVVGTTNGSIFLRNVENAIVIATCQQLRLRDCKNCTIFLFSVTGPIIESSWNIGFACSTLYYNELNHHLSKAQFNLWNNKWYSVYDFTSNSNTDNNQPHYHYLSDNITMSSFYEDDDHRISEMDRDKLKSCGFLQQQEFQLSVWPKSIGIQGISKELRTSDSDNLNSNQSDKTMIGLIIALADQTHVLMDICKSFTRGCYIQRTISKTLTKDAINNIFDRVDVLKLKIDEKSVIIAIEIIEIKGTESFTSNIDWKYRVISKDINTSNILFYFGEEVTTKSNIIFET